MRDHNAAITRTKVLDHNAPITQTAQPRICFLAKKPVCPTDASLKKRAGIVDEWARKYSVVTVFGEKFDMDLWADLVEAPLGVQEFTSDFWTSRLKELEKETSELDRKRVRALRLLRNAYIGDDEDCAREILQKVEELCAFREELSNEPSTTSNRGRVRLFYPLIFGKALKQARVRMWPTESGEFLPVIWCPDMTTAMFAHAAFERVETCLNCAKLFCKDLPRVDDSRSEKYCTVACGQRFRQRIYRKRQAKEVKGKSR